MIFLYQIFALSIIEVVSANATALHDTRAVTNAALNKDDCPATFMLSVEKS